MANVVFYFRVLLFLLLGPGAVIAHLYQGSTVVAFFWSLPTIAIILAFLFPGVGPGHFALTHEFGPTQEDGESERHYHLKMAKWWFLGSLILPLSVLAAYVFQPPDEYVALGFLIGILLGIPCFLKFLGGLFNAARAKS